MFHEYEEKKALIEQGEAVAKRFRAKNDPVFAAQIERQVILLNERVNALHLTLFGEFRKPKVTEDTTKGE